jgi:hypothetical protein
MIGMKMKLSILLIIIISLNIRINAQEISPCLFGQNHWIATGDEGNRIGYMDVLWPKVKESGVKCIRIGGNAYNHRFPERKRLTAIIDSIRNIGAEPLLQVPVGFTAIQAMELVEYYTKPGNKKVKYWSIGNEPLLHKDFTIEQIHEYIMRIAPAMKKVDPTLKLFVFDECELREKEYRELCGGRLDISGLKENGAWLIDGFNFHRYPNGREFGRDDVVFSGPENILAQTKLLKQIMEEADKKHNRTGDAKLMWGLSEVNVTYANPDREIAGYGNTSFLGGQFMAEVYGIGMQFGAFSVNPWCISETDAVSTDFGYLGLPREFYPRSSYYHTQMMAENMKGSYVNTSDNQKYVKTIASKSEDQIAILVMNQDQTTDFDFDIMLNKIGKSNKPLAIIADAALDVTFSGRVENQTSMLFVFDSKGILKKQIIYGLRHNLKNMKPDIK